MCTFVEEGKVTFWERLLNFRQFDSFKTNQMQINSNIVSTLGTLTLFAYPKRTIGNYNICNLCDIVYDFHSITFFLTKLLVLPINVCLINYVFL